MSQPATKEPVLCWCVACTHIKPFAAMCIECRKTACAACYDPNTKLCAWCKKEARRR